MLRPSDREEAVKDGQPWRGMEEALKILFFGGMGVWLLLQLLLLLTTYLSAEDWQISGVY